MWRILVLLGRIAVLTVVWTSAYLFECATAFMQCDANRKKYIVNLCGPEIKKRYIYILNLLVPSWNLCIKFSSICTWRATEGLYLFRVVPSTKELEIFISLCSCHFGSSTNFFSLSFPPPPSPFTSLHLRSWSCSGMHFVTSSVSLHSLGEFLDSSGGSLSDRCLNLCPCLSCALIYVLNPKIFGSLLKRWY